MPLFLFYEVLASKLVILALGNNLRLISFGDLFLVLCLVLCKDGDLSPCPPSLGIGEGKGEYF